MPKWAMGNGQWAIGNRQFSYLNRMSRCSSLIVSADHL